MTQEKEEDSVSMEICPMCRNVHPNACRHPWHTKTTTTRGKLEDVSREDYAKYVISNYMSNEGNT